ncbi:hypothetical protein RHGRI_029331 [Rhododendron griersonianum]|uniref:Uncharacterized protein n=1 Tax=Rhododendron griersonianum TaxID=479676 RepID=A0AAV6IL54_9ERIC|nr:hypothetical protein RHGRI_029331 [Rhododendron griersonianum]
MLDKIQPPRPEDTGIEDYALPPDSIKEAFLKAATTVVSRATLIFEKEEERCVEDPRGKKRGTIWWGERGCGSSARGCVAEKGGGVGEAMRYEVAAGLTEAEERVDRRGSGGGRGGLCMDRAV